MTWLRIDEASCRALLDVLRLDIALVNLTVAGVKIGISLVAK